MTEQKKKKTTKPTREDKQNAFSNFVARYQDNAHPVVITLGEFVGAAGGFTKREYIATKVFAQALIMLPRSNQKDCAAFAISAADELLKQLNETK